VNGKLAGVPGAETGEVDVEHERDTAVAGVLRDPADSGHEGAPVVVADHCANGPVTVCR
jgi:hypothetical protein